MTDALTEFVQETQNRPTIDYARHDIVFRGSAKEYFGIWIVNVLLSIATLGVYTAWAKVRNKKYFYGNTFLDGQNFDYHAEGQQILIGRLIVVGFLGLSYFLQSVSVNAYIGLYVILFLLIGIFVSRALRFNARMSSYRNVRFNFEGNGWRAFLSFGLYWLLNFATLYLAHPFVTRSKNRYTTRQHKYGDRYFDFDAKIGEYYGPFFATLFILFIGFIFVALVGNMILGPQTYRYIETETEWYIRYYFRYFMSVGIFFTIWLIYRAAVRNIIFNNAILDDKHRFQSTVEPATYMWIYFSNAIAAIFSLGLLIPWGRVRIARYMAENTKVLALGPLDVYSSDVIETHGVTAAEYTDIDGFDIDIGI